MKQMKIPKAAVLGMMAGVLLSLVTGAILTALIHEGALPEAAINYGGWIGAALAGFVTGAVAVRRAGKSAIPSALAGAGCYLAVTLGAGTMLSGWTGREAAIHGALVLLTALAGGVLSSGGRYKNGKKRYRV